MKENKEKAVVHRPVLLKEVLEIFQPKSGQVFVDGTANGGGHTFALWDAIQPEGQILAIDKDGDLIDALTKKAKEKTARVNAVQGSYRDIKKIADENHIRKVDGVLLDLGYSSYHLERSGRGFSFQKDEPLIMRYENSMLGGGLTAYKVVNTYPETELARILYEYGGERRSRAIAKAVCMARKQNRIKTSRALADIVASVFLGKRSGRIHSATRTFQALRIFVNNELDELEHALPDALDVLCEGGMLAVISFHSLEDKLVKDFMKKSAQLKKARMFTKKPLRPARAEVLANPRARSAKLRACVKIENVNLKMQNDPPAGGQNVKIVAKRHNNFTF